MKQSPLSLATGILLFLTGVVWILQGLDIAFAPQSFMTGNPTWVIWGAVSTGLGLFLVLRSVRKR